jgi:two-component system alkaline phosphatase synthesis response regulator PhoP
MARRGDTYPHGLNLPEALALGRRLQAELPARIHLIGIEIRPALAFASGFSPELADRLPAVLAEARRLLADLLKGGIMAQKVLLVDDDYDFIVATRTVLEAAGYTVQTAGGGKEGLEKVRSFQPDLVVLDVMMPAPDGLEVCETLKASSDTRGIPVIMLTAVASHVKSTDFTHQAGKATEADDYLPKPVNPQVLLERIKKLVR